MQIIDVPNPDAKLLIDWMARQMRAREVMMRRCFIPWWVRKVPGSAPQRFRELDAIFRENARNYTKSAP